MAYQTATNFANSSAAYFQIRVNDPDIESVAMNGSGYYNFFRKNSDFPLNGEGVEATGDFIWFINSVYSWYWTIQADFDLLKQLIENAITVTGGGDALWLTEDPIMGTVDPDGGMQVIDVTFDAGMVTQPGTYLATIDVDTDDPVNRSFEVAVTMNVSAPPNYGRLEGIVIGLGYCDEEPVPLEEATILIESSTGMTWTQMTDDAGHYGLYLPEEGSPYTVSVMAEEHETGYAEGVIIVGQETTTLNFDLRWLEPCVSVDPTAFDVTVGLGYSITEALELINSGAADSDFELAERDGGFTPGVLVGGVGEWLYQAEQGVPMLNNQGETVLAYPKAYRWTPNQPSQMNVLIYADDAYHWAPNTFLDQALQNLGIAYTAHYDGDFFGFVNDLQSGTWDMVLVGNDNWADTSIFNPLNDYVLSGGKLVINTWAVSWDPFNSLWTTLGVTWVSDDWDPPDPVYWWDPAHPLFNEPESVPELTQLSGFRYGTYGQRVEPILGDYVALAGYTTPGPDPNQAALVLGNDNTTIFKGFLDGQNDADRDFDGLMDGVELWINMIVGLESGFGGDIPWLIEDPITGTVGADSSFFVDLIFDTSVLTQTGDYTGTLKVKSDDPVNKSIDVPLMLHVVPPAFGVDLSGDDAQSGIPGEIVMYTLVVTNSSNGPMDSFDVAVGSSVFPTLPDVTTIGPLAAGDTTSFNVAVEIPVSSLPGESDAVDIIVTSQGDDTKSDVATLTTTVLGEYGVLMTAENTEGSGEPGAMVAYTVHLTNIGTLQDTIVLTYYDVAPGWEVQLDDDSFDLAGGESVGTTFHVLIPAGAASGDWDAFMLQAVSWHDPSKWNEMEFTTTVVVTMPQIYLPIINRH
jgi:hypothetical protein